MATPRLYNFDIFGRVMGATPQGGVGGIPSRPSSLYENIVQPTMGTGTVGAVPTTTGTTVPQATGSTANPVTLPSYDQLQPIIDKINESNRLANTAALAGRIPGGTDLERLRSSAISNLFNPNPQLAELDVGGAAAAVGSGTVGSPFAGITGLNRTEKEILERQAKGSAMLNEAYTGNPAAPIANPQALFEQLVNIGQSNRELEERARQAALDRQLRLQLANMEFYNRGYGRNQPSLPKYGSQPSSWFGGGLPTQYGRPGTAPPSGSSLNIPPVPPDTGGGRPGSYDLTVTQVPGGVPENWMDLSPEYRQQYLTGIGANPYYNLPDYLNPYSGDVNPMSYPVGGIVPTNPENWGALTPSQQANYSQSFLENYIPFGLNPYE